VPPKWAPASIQKIAINAVMAGCRSDYFPVVLAAVECVLDESFNLYGVQATTNPVAPCFVVNGPIRIELEMNCGYGVFGEGNRANSTIGRAVRLVLRNIGGGILGELDRSTTGWPGRIGLCFGENEEQNPWEPLSVDRGFPKGTNTISLFGIGGYMNLEDHHSTTGLGMLQHFSRMLAMGAGGPYTGSPLISLCPDHIAVLMEDGFDKSSIKKYLFENARIKPAGLTQPVAEEWIRLRNYRNQLSGSDQPETNMETWIPFATSVESISVVVAGGAGRHSGLLIPTFTAASVTKEIRR